jgi:hypothetical protein
MLRLEINSADAYYPLIQIDGELATNTPQNVSSKKKEMLEVLVEISWLAKAVYDKNVITISQGSLKKRSIYQLEGQPITFFGAHELLRKTRNIGPQEDEMAKLFNIGSRSVSYEDLRRQLSIAIPNTNLTRKTNNEQYLTNPLFPATSIALLTAIVMAREMEGTTTSAIAATSLGVGALTGAGSWIYDRIKYGRSVFKTAPWNAELYVDTNIAVLRADPSKLYMANRNVIPRPEILGLKFDSAYYPLVQGLQSQNFMKNLQAKYAAHKKHSTE